jgi:pimeloyl-ACP methyl ester carboxylesterase
MREGRHPPRRPSAATPIVVFVPGVGLDARSWTAVRAGLTAPSIVVSLPSMGRRATADADLHVEAHARRVIAALPAQGDLILVGHSAGCPVAVEVAAREPRVLALVLVGPVTDPRARSWSRMLAQWLRTALHEHPWEVRVLARQYRWTGWGSMLRGMTRIRRYRTDVALSHLRVPTSVIRGQHDHIASERWCAQLTRNPRAELVSVPRAAHMVPLTHPHAVVEAIERLARLDCPTPGAQASTMTGMISGLRRWVR